MNDIAAVVLAIVFVAVILRQLSGRGPPIWTLFVGGGFLTLAAGVLSLGGAESAISASAPTLVFLFALFVFAAALASAGVIDHLARWVIGVAKRPEDLPFFLFVGIGLVSSVMINDALVVIGVPILILAATRLRAAPKPLLLVLAFGVTVGSTLTPFGNPQNLLVAVQSGLTFPVATFLRYLAVPTAINLLLGGWYLRTVFRRAMPAPGPEYDRVRGAAPAFWPHGGWGRRVLDRPVLVIFPATMIALVGLDIASAVTSLPSVPVWEVALAGAVVLVLLSPHRATILQGANWSILLLFAGLFVVVAGAVSGGVITGLEAYLPIPGPGHPLEATGAVVASSLAGSQFVSNVPWVALQLPLLSGLGYGPGTPVIWMALAAGSTLAGNVTLLGAVSNLIVVDSAARQGVHIGLGEFVRYGLPLTLITVGVLLGCLAIGL
jgi:Na+/H+ antiporter NhaD/arsenite permease-like protein